MRKPSQILHIMTIAFVAAFLFSYQGCMRTSCNRKPKASSWIKEVEIDKFSHTEIITIPNNGYLFFSFSLLDYDNCSNFHQKLIKFSENGEIEWENVFNDRKANVIQYVDGGFIMAGTISTSKKNCDVWIQKIDYRGNKLWEQTLGRPDNDYIKAILQTKDGGYLAKGVMGSSSGYLTPRTFSFLFKLNSLGKMVWKKNFEPSVRLFDFRETEQGNILLTGQISDEKRRFFQKPFLIEMDRNGENQRTKYLNEPFTDWGFSIMKTPDGGFILAGCIMWSSSGDFTTKIVKYNSQWIMQWFKVLSKNIFYGGIYMIQASNGDLIIIGRTAYEIPFRYHILNPGFIRKVDMNGNDIWEHLFYDEYNLPENIIQTSEGNFVLSGISGDPFTKKRHVYIIKFDANGNKIWEKTLLADLMVDKINQTSDGGFIFSGSKSPSYNDESDSDQKSERFMIIKLDENGNCFGPGCRMLKQKLSSR